MEFSFKNYNRVLGELTVKDYNSNITTDVVGSLGSVPQDLIDNMTDVAIEMVQFNGHDVVEHLYDIIQRHLNGSQLEELIMMIAPEDEEE